jgi:hypothetical protein
MKPPVIAVIACAAHGLSNANQTHLVNYIFTEPKPETRGRPDCSRNNPHGDIRAMYDALEFQARREYGDDVGFATMGCGISVSTSAPLPAHLAIAAESADFSLLRQGWRFVTNCWHYAEPIPPAVLGELALTVRRAIAENPAWEVARANCAGNAADYLHAAPQQFPRLHLGAIIEAARKLP